MINKSFDEVKENEVDQLPFADCVYLDSDDSFCHYDDLIYSESDYDQSFDEELPCPYCDCFSDYLINRSCIVCSNCFTCFTCGEYTCDANTPDAII